MFLEVRPRRRSLRWFSNIGHFTPCPGNGMAAFGGVIVFTLVLGRSGLHAATITSCSLRKIECWRKRWVFRLCYGGTIFVIGLDRFGLFKLFMIPVRTLSNFWLCEDRWLRPFSSNIVEVSRIHESALPLFSPFWVTIRFNTVAWYGCPALLYWHSLMLFWTFPLSSCYWTKFNSFQVTILGGQRSSMRFLELNFGLMISVTCSELTAFVCWSSSTFLWTISAYDLCPPKCKLCANGLLRCFCFFGFFSPLYTALTYTVTQSCNWTFCGCFLGSLFDGSYHAVSIFSTTLGCRPALNASEITASTALHCSERLYKT